MNFCHFLYNCNEYDFVRLKFYYYDLLSSTCGVTVLLEAAKCLVHRYDSI